MCMERYAGPRECNLLGTSSNTVFTFLTKKTLLIWFLGWFEACRLLCQTTCTGRCLNGFGGIISWNLKLCYIIPVLTLDSNQCTYYCPEKTSLHFYPFHAFHNMLSITLFSLAQGFVFLFYCSTVSQKCPWHDVKQDVQVVSCLRYDFSFHFKQGKNATCAQVYQASIFQMLIYCCTQFCEQEKIFSINR